MSRGAVIACTDDDVVPDRWWLRALGQRLVRCPEASVVTGLSLPAALDTPAQRWFEEYGGWDHGYDVKSFRSAELRQPHLIWSRGGSMGGSNNVAFRREALQEVGGFDERFGPGTPTRAAEDLELLLRLLLAGHEIVYDPAALIFHDHRRDVEGLRRQLEGYGRGMGALLTTFALSNPRRAWDIARTVPSGMRRLVDPRSDRNRKRSRSFPPALTRAEIYGYLAGPWALWRSTRADRRWRT